MGPTGLGVTGATQRKHHGQSGPTLRCLGNFFYGAHPAFFPSTRTPTAFIYLSKWTFQERSEGVPLPQA